MGLTKAEIFKDEHNKLSSLFKVLGHPARISILQYIIDNKTCTCNDLIDELGLAQATISQHLKELKNAGIIDGTIDGKFVNYNINENMWITIRGSFAIFFAQSL